MPEELEKQQVNFRIDPSIHRLMHGIKDVLGMSSVADAYSLAAEEFILNHPEIVEGLEGNLHDEAEVTQRALQALIEIRSSQP